MSCVSTFHLALASCPRPIPSPPFTGRPTRRSRRLLELEILAGAVWVLARLSHKPQPVSNVPPTWIVAGSQGSWSPIDSIHNLNLNGSPSQGPIASDATGRNGNLYKHLLRTYNRPSGSNQSLKCPCHPKKVARLHPHADAAFVGRRRP
jgi:hypothetical protein